MDRDREREFKRKRFMSFIIVSGYVFFGGCEYVVVLPTVWVYLQTLGVTEEHWLGFTVSRNIAFCLPKPFVISANLQSFAAAVAGVIVGRLADKYYKHTKAFVVGSIAFRVVGNFQYMLGINKWNILCARLLCGIGTACGTALLAEVCRTTQVEERTKYLSMYNAMFQVGILIGPALQFILKYFNFTIYGLEVNPLNAPGLFLGVLWVIYLFASVFMLYNLTEEFRDIEERKKYSRVGGRGSILTLMSESIAVEDARKGGLLKNKKEESSVYKKYLDEFLTDSYVLLLSLVFCLLFSIICFETVTPVITQKYFGFGVEQNTLIYMAGGIEALVTFLGIAMIGKYVRETTLQIVGLTLILGAQIWLIIVLPNFEKGNPTHVIYFLGGIFLIYLGNPIASVGNSALSSKVLSNETQGLGQGIRRLFSYMGLIFGPTWAGSTVETPYLFLGVCIALMSINAIMLMFSHTSLRKAEDKILEASKRKAIHDEESTPLLSSTN